MVACSFLLLFSEPANLIPNGDFEQGARFWKLVNAEIVKGEGRGGSACARLRLKDARGIDFSRTKFYVVSEPFEVEPSQVYTLIVWWRNTGDALFWVHCWCFDERGQYVGDLVEGQIREGKDFFGPADFWHRRISFVKFHPQAKKARLCLELIGGAGEVRFDDVALFRGKVDDPALRHRPELRIRFPRKIRLGEEIRFEAVSLLPPGRKLVGIRWEGPSRRVGRRKVPYGWEARQEGTHFVLRPEHLGRFTVRAFALDSLGAESQPAEAEFEVLPNEPPVASFKWRVLPDGLIEFDASQSFDPDGKVADFIWEFPDGEVLRGRRVRHRLGGIGVEPIKPLAYTVRLTVVDEHGLRGTREEEVRLSLPPKRGREKPTLSEEILIEIDDEGARLTKVPRKCSVRLGFREYLPVRIVNRTSRSCAVEASGAQTEPNVFVRGFSSRVRSEAEKSLEIQSFLFCDTEAMVEFKVDHQSLRVPLRLEVKETMPLFGTQEHFTRTPPGRKRALWDMAYLKFLPCQLYRLPDTLTGLASPRRNWKTADWYIRSLLEVGRTRALPFLGYIPTRVWADLRDGKTEEWEESVRLIVRRFRDRIDYWESYNEPPWNEEVMGWPEEDIAEALWNLMESFYRAVKSEDPEGKVVMPGWAHPSGKMRRVIERLFERGVHRIVDVFNFHSYTCDRNLPLTPDSAPRWRRYDEECVGLTRWMLELMRRYGGANKPLWNTECGGHVRGNMERSRAMQWLRFSVLSLFLGVKGLFQYEFFDYPHDAHPPTLYLMRSEGHRPTPFFQAYHEIILALTGAKPTGRVETGLDGLTALSFERGNERLLCLWSNSERVQLVRLKVNKATLVEVVDVSFHPRGPFVRKAKWLPERDSFSLVIEPLEFRILDFVQLGKGGELGLDIQKVEEFGAPAWEGEKGA